MSTIPRWTPPTQESERTRVARLALQLTPLQRHLVTRAGLPHWLRLPAPWQPCPGRQTAAAHALASAEFGLLEPSPTLLGGYQLTALGEAVAGVWLLAALTTERPTGSSFTSPASGAARDR